MKILVDTMNVVFIVFHMARKQLHDQGKVLDEENLGFYIHLLINKLHQIMITYPNPIFCWEGYHSLDWRKSIFPDYKANRKQQKTEDEYLVMKKFFPKLEEILNFYPCKQIRVDEAEADDLIFTLSEKYQNEEIIIISTDGDLSQIMNFFPNVSIYNPIKRMMVEKKPNVLIEKAICGDASDNIPGLFRIGPKTLEKMLLNNGEWEKVMKKGNNRKIYDNFLKIVDLRLFPDDIKQKIKKVDDEIKYNKFNPDQLELIFWDLKLQDILKRWENIKGDIYLSLGFENKTNNLTNNIENNIINIKNETEEEKNIDEILSKYI